MHNMVRVHSCQAPYQSFQLVLVFIPLSILFSFFHFLLLLNFEGKKRHTRNIGSDYKPSCCWRDTVEAGNSSRFIRRKNKPLHQTNSVCHVDFHIRASTVYGTVLWGITWYFYLLWLRTAMAFLKSDLAKTRCSKIPNVRPLFNDKSKMENNLLNWIINTYWSLFNWQSVCKGVTLPSPWDGWDRLQNQSDPQCGNKSEGKSMDGWSLFSAQTQVKKFPLILQILQTPFSLNTTGYFL